MLHLQSSLNTFSYFTDTPYVVPIPPASFHVTPSKLDFNNYFLLQLATPQQWTNTLHMIVPMHVLGERHKSVLLMHNSVFTTPELTSLMLSKDRQFQAAVRKDRLRWDSRLTKLILAPRLTWMKEVHTVYTPMIWADKHWVGLAINLAIGHVEVMDSAPTLYDDGKVLKFMKPILQMLPYLVRYVAKNNARNLSPFTWERIPGTYETLGLVTAAPFVRSSWKCTSTTIHIHTCQGSQMPWLTSSARSTQWMRTKPSSYQLTSLLQLGSLLITRTFLVFRRHLILFCTTIVPLSAAATCFVFFLHLG
ncbi:hypothetical protein YC2023_088867 [Brassica napus]